MAFQSAPNTAQAMIKFLQNDVPVANCLEFEFSGAYSGADLTALCDVVDAWVVTSYLPTCGPETVYQGTFVKGLTNAVDYTASNTSNAGAAGGQPFSEPNNVTKAFAFQSGMSGRNSRGRMFHAGLPNNALTDTNHVTQSWVDDVVDALELLKLAIEALDWVWVIVSRYLDGAKRAVAVNYNVTTFNVANLTTDSARGRLPKS